jgi:hypothetical protein
MTLFVGSIILEAVLTKRAFRSSSTEDSWMNILPLDG